MIDYEDVLTDDGAWFLSAARGEKSGPRLVAICREMARLQATLITNTERCISVFQYGGDAKDMNPTQHWPVEENLVTFNAAKNTIETVHAKVCKQRIAPMPLTTGGGYLQRHRAKQMGKAIEGVLADNYADDLEDEVIMDALTTDHGGGAIKVLDRGDRVKLEHIPVEDVWFDDAETRQRKPRCCYHIPRDGVDKYVAIEMFASDDDDDYPGLVGTAEERKRAILKAANRPESWRGKTTPRSKHRVDIFEAWHLPSGDPEEYEEDEEYEDKETGETKTRKVKKVRHDGRHVISVDGEDGTLVDEPWDYDFFPILLYVPRPRRRHIWGMSLMRDLLAPQREYERLTKKIQHQHQKMGVSGFSSPRGANLDAREITAGTHGAAFVVEHDGPTPPAPFVIEPVAQGTYAYAASLPRDMLERHGISTMAAASQIPAGLQQASGRALLVFEDAEDVRLLPYHRERERFKIALSWIIVCMAKRIVEREGSYKARYRGKRGIEVVDWKDVLMDKEDFVLRVFPISALSKQPAARFEQLTELLSNQAITVEQFKRLFEIPDLEAENELDSSDTDIIDRAMDIMVTTGRYLSPEPFDNLELIIQRAGKFYNVCRQQEVPDERLKLLRDYMEDAKGLIDQKNALAQAQAGAATPPGAGGPPPPGMGGPEPAPAPGMPGPGGPPPAMPAAA